ncbi:MAG: ABC transporter ATP-binding protein [Candidatus Lernaella stagnicola]|nr:ABC transporter ATP-binding protein [Candidatus Lernaella stagnicola]
MSLLTVTGLKKNFADVAAVAGIDFAVAPGEIFGLIGPDGAGKTTTLRMIVGLMDPDAGAVTVGDIDVAHDPESVREMLGYMPQQYSLYPDLTVAENLRFFADMYFVPAGERETRMKRLFEFSRLEPYAKRPAGKLSGGMYKKLALSCNMIHTPRLLLLDEPTNGVDPLSRRELWQILYAFAAEGVAIVVSTPYMDEAERCHRVALMHAGRMLSVDEPAAILSGYADALFAVDVEDQPKARQALAARAEVRRVYPTGDILKVAVPPGTGGEQVRDWLRASGVEPTYLQPVQPNFEDVFLAAVEERT